MVPVLQSPATPMPAQAEDGLELSDRGLGEDHVPTEIPVRLGRYLIDSEIGRGAMGVIYKGRQEKLDRWVAIKMLLPGAMSSPEMVKRFQREARSAARLKHPNIVTIHEVGDSEGKPFFTMDLIEGISLDTMMEAGKLDAQVILPIIRDVALAVDYANSNGIIHRDLKPANILIDGEGKPRITDFGLAKDISSASVLSVSGEIMGTPDYMSPEQAAGRIHEIDGRTDVFALGAILYAALTGAPPHQGATLTDTLMRIVNNDPIPPEHKNLKIDSDLSAVMMKAIEKDRNLRYKSAADFAADIDRYLAGDPVIARPMSLARRFKRKLRRHCVAVAAVVAAAVVLALGMLVAPLIFGRSYLTFAKSELASPNAAVRANTVKALSDKLLDTKEIKEQEIEAAVDLLVARLSDEDASVRDAALLFLERCAYYTGKALPGARQFPSSKLEPIRIDRIRRLALQKTVESLAATLAKQKGFEKVSPERKTLMLRILSILAAAGDLRAVPLIIDLLQSPHDEIRLNACRALAKLPDRRALKPLLIVNLNDEVCRTEAKIALDSLYENSTIAPFSSHDSAVKEVMRGMTDAISSYNQRAQELIDEMDGKSKSSERKLPLEETFKALKSSNMEDRFKAAYELRQFPDPSVVAALIDALGDEEFDVGRAAARSLAEVIPAAMTHLAGSGGGQPAGSAAFKPHNDIAKQLESTSANARANAAYALALLKSTDDVDGLIIALQKEQSQKVKIALIDALRRLGDRRATPYLEELQNDADPVVKEKASSALLSIKAINQ
jgi:HEAT repeat protein/tRNA A-37 threonylcarbamoyl transferase component Bud32